MAEKRISLIIPVYNAETYLAECLESVARETLPPYELILVDDGSTDGSAGILKRFQEEHPGWNVLVVRQENGGVSCARNTGLSRVTGDYVSFLDADDLLLPGFLADMAERIGDADVCVGGKRFLNTKSGRLYGGRCPSYTGDLKTVRRHLFPSLRLMRGVTGRLFRTAVIKKNGLTFREELRYGEDMVFNFDFFMHIRQAVFTGDAFYIYRTDNPDSLVHRESPFFLKQWKMQRACTARLRKEAKKHEHF